ncbi:PREDICTED: uncharacterized protein LOC104798970 isoform X2 [Tarenaya hassleriana]|uniref:uncharacterized protein LOC104798970 isoform X2 n=1 Tax=Tarenaya hassleriana TaxID=28532 RepID=UPI00053C301E|nr:PREDICTED: uncharacterized protein LOC104798970 isoform X2 [Tarenaya hassleriana]
MSSSSSYTESKDSWHPAVTADTTSSSYWFNWRVLICFIWMVIAMISTAFLIFKYEGFRKKRGHGGEKEWGGNVYEDETWKPCLRGIHPAWLLAYRFVAFFVLLVMLIVIGLVDGPTIFYYYTQWTFTLITLYFGLGSLLSLHGCYQYNKRAAGERVGNVEIDSEHGIRSKKPDTLQEIHDRKPAGLWGYIFQIVFQMNAGAVLLTDCVFWFIIVPFLEIHDYSLNVLVISMHSLNAIFLLEVSLFQDCLLLPLDSSLCHVPMDSSLLSPYLVALPLPGFSISLFSALVSLHCLPGKGRRMVYEIREVLISCSDAFPMLRSICLVGEAETPASSEMVLRVLPDSEIFDFYIELHRRGISNMESITLGLLIPRPRRMLRSVITVPEWKCKQQGSLFMELKYEDVLQIYNTWG